MSINDKSENKSKGVALKVDVENEKEQVEEDIDNYLSNSINLLSKRFGKVMRRLNKRSKNNAMTNVKDKLLTTREVLTRSTKEENETNQIKAMRYNVMSVKVSKTFKKNVQFSFGSKIKDTPPHCHMKILKRTLMMKRLTT